MITRINIGSGPGTENIEGTLRIDLIPNWCDSVCDIRREKLPVEDGTIEYIECHQTLEHIQLNEDFLFAIKEMHRVLKEGGILDITVPHKDSEMAYDSYEHTRYFNESSFMNFYNNRYADEMNLPVFKCLIAERRMHGNGEDEVHITLEKI